MNRRRNAGSSAALTTMLRVRPRSLPGARRERALFTVAFALVGWFVGSSAAAGETPPSAPAAEATPTPPDAPSPEPAPMGALARERYEEGLRLYGARDFAAAISLFEEGFALEPRREFLFAEAQAHRLAGNCARAVPLYRRFLETAPSAIQVDATRLGLDRCAKQEAAAATAARTAPPPEPAPPGGARKPASDPIPPPTRPEQRPWWQDPPGLLAAGVGVATLGVGIGYWIASNRSLDQAGSRETPNVIVYDRLYQTAVDRRAVAIVALATGATALAGGLARLIYVRQRDLTIAPTTGVALTPTDGGAALLWQGRY